MLGAGRGVDSGGKRGWVLGDGRRTSASAAGGLVGCTFSVATME